ncbi:hypothetical protein ACH4VR_15155 [Streptomyces sp. NPDC020883]|uniref:hypothetical protein n=1 Tax=Streptomyces sp. NPDC020883 TaxID=3365099 RepID=UPI00378E5133
MNHVPQISIEEHTVADHAAGPCALTTGRGGALWFTLNQANAIGPIGMDGAAPHGTG